MQKVNFSIFINADKEKVWNTMLGKETYKKWTEPFSPGSHFEGDWSQGSKILFLAPARDGQGEEGMVSKIAESQPYEFVSIEHLGFFKNGVEDTESEEVKKWIPAFENYTFTEKDGGTEVLVELDLADEYKDMFNEMWPKALEKLKEISE